MVRTYTLPFYAGEDIKEEELEDYFCDREEEIKEITRFLSSEQKQHIALIGKRRIGKSSFLVKCKAELKKMNVPSIFIKIEKVYPFNLSNLFSYILKEIEDTFLKNFKYSVKKTGKSIIKSILPKKIDIEINNTISLWGEFDDSRSHQSLQELMKKTFSTIDKVGQHQKKFVIMLDEFQRFFDFDDDFLWAFRGHISDLKNTSFIVSSSLTSFEDQITEDKNQPFFKFFFLKKINELPKPKVRNFVIKRFKKFQITIIKDALNLFIELSDCHPYYVQVLGLKCYDIAKANDLKFIDREIVLNAYEYLFDMIPHNLITEFEKITGKMKEIVIVMAKKELERPRDIAKELKINERSIGAFLKKIENRHGIITTVERGKYKFIDNFLEEWIKRNHVLEEESESDLLYKDFDRQETFNSELVDNYIHILKNTSLSTENINRLLLSIRNETHKIYSKRKIEKVEIPTIKNLIIFCCESINNNKKEEIRLHFLDILMLLTRATTSLEMIKVNCFETLKNLYLKGDKNLDLWGILNACGYFKDTIEEILKKIDERNENLLNILISKFDYLKYKNKKFELIKQLLLKLETLDNEKDKNLVVKIENFIRQLEMA